MKVKVGDKVRVVTDAYPSDLRVGSIESVLWVGRSGMVEVNMPRGGTIFLSSDQYEITAEKSIPDEPTTIHTQCLDKMNDHMGKGEYVRAIKWAQVAEMVKDIENE